MINNTELIMTEEKTFQEICSSCCNFCSIPDSLSWLCSKSGPAFNRKRSECKCNSARMGNKQFYPIISNISFTIRKICRHNWKKKGLFTWNFSFYNFNLSDYFFTQHNFSDSFKDIPGTVKCNDLWYKPGNNNIGLSARRTRKGNGNKYYSSLSGIIMWPGNRRITYAVFRMEKHFCFSGSFWNYFTYTYQEKNKNRMG